MRDGLDCDSRRLSDCGIGVLIVVAFDVLRATDVGGIAPGVDGAFVLSRQIALSLKVEGIATRVGGVVNAGKAGDCMAEGVQDNGTRVGGVVDGDR